MPRIVFIEHSGKRHEVEADVGQTVMEAAIKNEIPGIPGECGGACACATCHVYVDPVWMTRIEEAGEPEEDMLDFAYDVRENSRLSCQIRVSKELDGFTVTIPEKQA
ncbi:MAG TPA: 2Fe-2S iron-sulfur cluster binding domain-containing protein [Rhizobiales bacterium]|nr:2Fe-2S iron-sulfur cluster binding domain-containing protein [Hyphomicrobiales bacterium]